MFTAGADTGQGKSKGGRPPIPAELVERVQAAYAATGSQRKTAENTGLSRTSVQNIVNGRHLNQKSQSQLPKRGLADGEIRLVVARRCSNCGHMVEVWPCRECLADVYRRVERHNALRELEHQ